MHKAEKIAEAYEMLKAGFKKEIVARRTGISTSTLSLIKSGKRQCILKRIGREQAKQFSLPADDYKAIIREARKALIDNGRETRI